MGSWRLDRSKTAGRKSICRECDRAKSGAYYEAHREEVLVKRGHGMPTRGYVASFHQLQLVRIDYVPAHILQAYPSVFKPRKPLSATAKRAGWQGSSSISRSFPRLVVLGSSGLILRTRRRVRLTLPSGLAGTPFEVPFTRRLSNSEQKFRGLLSLRPEYFLAVAPATRLAFKVPIPRRNRAIRRRRLFRSTESRTRKLTPPSDPIGRAVDSNRHPRAIFRRRIERSADGGSTQLR